MATTCKLKATLIYGVATDICKDARSGSRSFDSLVLLS
jgi:hypothetical protein